MSKNITRQASKVMQDAINLSRERKHTNITALHIGYASLKDTSGICANIIKKCSGNVEQAKQNIDAKLKKMPECSPVPESPHPSSSYQYVMSRAEKQQQDNRDKFLSLSHILHGLSQDPDIVECLGKANCPVYSFQQCLQTMSQNKKMDSEDAEEQLECLEKYCTELVKKAEEGKLDPCIGRDTEIRRVTEILSRRTKNNPVLTGYAGVGKTQIVEGLAMRVLRGDVPQSLLGVKIFALDMGALLAGAKYRGEFEERMKGVIDEIKKSEGSFVLFIDELHTLMGSGSTGEGGTDAANLLKPALARGEIRCIGATTTAEYRKFIAKDRAFERRFAEVQVDEPGLEDTISILRGIAEKYANHHQVRITDQALVAAARLADRYIRAIGRRNPDAAIDLLDEACSAVRVALDSQPEVLDQLNRKKTRLEIELESMKREFENFGSQQIKERMEQIKKELNDLVVEMGPIERQYQTERSLIDKVAVLKEKLSKAREKLELFEIRKEVEKAADLKYGVIPELEEQIKQFENQSHQNSKTDTQLLKATITENEIALAVNKWTGIPVQKLTQSDRQKYLLLNQIMKQKVIGQDYAVQTVTDAILRQKANLSRKQQPLGSFLFLGSSGSGKTHLAKTLAAELFDSEQNLVRIDMSEYTEAHSLSRLIGAPPGYVGYDQAGQLTEAVLKKRYCVVLFDEVEKAHQKVLNVLLQIMDDGRLTDGQGTTVDFTNTVIMLTSNLGSSQLLENQGNYEKAKEKVMQVVKNHFPPELINRFDDIVVFSPLSLKNLKEIFNVLIQDLQKRVFEEMKLKLRIDGQIVDAAISECDAAYGARPLRRFIEREITTALAKLILSSQTKIQAGQFSLEIKGDEIVIGKNK